jgi:hypothetical protein
MFPTCKNPRGLLCPTKHAHEDFFFPLEEELAPHGSHFKNTVDWILEYVRYFEIGLANEPFREAALRYLHQVPALQEEATLSGRPLRVTGWDAVVWHLIGYLNFTPS